MKSSRIFLACLAMVFFSTVFCIAASAESMWSITDKGYKVWNESPQLNETVTWSGDADMQDRATGNGVLQWYQSGRQSEKYDGHMQKGKENGKGVYTWANGDRYEGDFVGGKQTGKGLYTWHDGSRYQGDFANNKRTGKGIFTWANGARYQGDFVNDKLTGKGIFTLANGSRYFGDFVDNKIQGYGTLYAPDGKILFQGHWINGSFVGQ